MSKRTNKRFQEIGEIAAYSWQMLLYPKHWGKNPRQHINIDHLNWRGLPFTNKSKNKLESRSGIYMFVITPYLGRLKDHSYIGYVGQTKNMKQRFQQYLKEAVDDEEGRYLLLKLLIPYRQFITFKWIYVDESELDRIEKGLIKSLQPPCNIRDRGVFANLMQAQPAWTW